MMLIFGKNTFFQVLNILSHKKVINIEGDTILMMQNEFCMCIRVGRTLGPRFKFSSKFGRFYWDCLAGQKNPEKPRKKKNPLGIGLKNIPFCFSSRICKIVETLTSIQLSEWWNELKAVLKKCTKVDANSNLAFSYFNYYNAKNLMKNLKH